MDNQTETDPKEPKGRKGKECNPFFEASRKVMLASIGAVALAQDELEDFIGKLIERGEIAEKDGNKLMREVREKRKKRAHDLEQDMTRKVRETMERMNIPSRADLEKLTESIATLAEKIDGLAQAQK